MINHYKKKTLFITNPISGSGEINNIADLLLTYLDERFDWTIYETTCKGDAISRSKRAVEESYDLVVAVGGDGTINEVAQGLTHSETAMGILPKGSGNGFAKHFGISSDFEKAIKQLNQSEETWIDTGWFGGHLFLNVAGIGFDAQVAHAFDTHGQRGLVSYVFLSIREFFRFIPPQLKIQTHDQTFQVKSFIFTVANGSQYGNNAFISPHSEIDDGFLDLVIVPPLKIWQWLSFPLRLFSKSLTTSPRYTFARATTIQIQSNQKRAHIDGEPIEIEENIQVEIKAKSLKMFAPPTKPGLE